MGDAFNNGSLLSIPIRKRAANLALSGYYASLSFPGYRDTLNNNEKYTMERYQKLMIGNAFLVIVISMFAGFMLGFGLIGGLELYPGTIIEMPYYGSADGWARAHAGGLTNGLLIIGVALALPLIPLSEKMRKFNVYGFIYIGWANTAFYWFGNAAGSRALSFGDNPLGASNIPGAIGFGLAFAGALLIVWLLTHGALAVLKEK
ncbi:MAG: hypothetical protein ACI87W_002500 [Halieaceae bacterium]|jgi:hypothetical protein